VKYGFIRDEKFFEYLENNYNAIFSFDEEVLTKIITRSCELKAEIVGRDEKESGERALLNFGHTFGHTFETETDFRNTSRSDRTESHRSTPETVCHRTPATLAWGQTCRLATALHP
jgi:hypothetical protein